MFTLRKMHDRIKYSRIVKLEKTNVERLYIRYGENGRDIKTHAWIEVVNDKLKVFCKVENYRSQSLYDTNLAERYKSEIESQLRELINDCELERKETPLQERLRDNIVPVYDDSSLKHQVDALRFCCSMKVSALYADTGTGKSKIVIDLAISRYESGQIKKVLVFLPASTHRNFEKQIALWSKSPGLKWNLIHHEAMGSSNKKVLEALDYCDNETQIIIDESHMIKTPIAKRSKRIKMVCDQTSYKVVMTGTPITDNIHNLYMQYAVLSDLIIGVRDWKKFEEKYLIMGGRFGDEIIGYKNVNHLMGLVDPYTYQVDSSECLNLPAKKILSHTCELTDLQLKYYYDEKEELLKLIKGDNFRATDIFQAFTRMQQICSGYYRNYDGSIEFLGTNKDELLKEVYLGEKTIFFCKYLFEIDFLVQYFGREKCAVFTGQNPKDRDAELEQFCAGSKQFFVATMQSGGTGLNGLQNVSRRIIFWSNSFSYFQRKQSIGRIDRHGQENEMFIHDFKTDANIDDKIIRNLRNKGNLADEIKRLMLDRTKLRKYMEEL